MVTAELTPVAGIPLDVVELRLKRRESAWTQMVTTAHSIGAVSEPEVVLAALAHRERWGSTALGKGCALAGIRSFGVRRSHLVLGRSERGVDWGAGDDDHGPGDHPRFGYCFQHVSQHRLDQLPAQVRVHRAGKPLFGAGEALGGYHRDCLQVRFIRKSASCLLLVRPARPRHGSPCCASGSWSKTT